MDHSIPFMNFPNTLFSPIPLISKIVPKQILKFCISGALGRRYTCHNNKPNPTSPRTNWQTPKCSNSNFCFGINTLMNTNKKITRYFWGTRLPVTETLRQSRSRELGYGYKTKLEKLLQEEIHKTNTCISIFHIFHGFMQNSNLKNI